MSKLVIKNVMGEGESDGGSYYKYEGELQMSKAAQTAHTRTFGWKFVLY